MASSPEAPARTSEPAAGSLKRAVAEHASRPGRRGRARPRASTRSSVRSVAVSAARSGRHSLLALALAIFTAFAYAELVTKYPQAAGAALYVNKAWRRPFLTFLVAFAVMGSGLTSAATLSRAFGGDYLSGIRRSPDRPRRADLHRRCCSREFQGHRRERPAEPGADFDRD